MSESAEAIARVMRDLKQNNIGRPTHDNDDGLNELNLDTADLATWGEVIDATPVWKRWMASEGGKMIYEDHRVCPPWDNAFVGFENAFGNVTVVSLRCVDISRAAEAHGGIRGIAEHWSSLADTHDIDWDRVRWVMHAALYMGGRTHGEPTPTVGPLHLWRIAIYPDGEIADVNWIQLIDLDPAQWDTAMMVLLDTFNLVNCANVQVVEPTRPRAAAKRLARTGFTINEIHIRPVSKSYRGHGTPLSQFEMPLHSVRGHPAEYGINGKGKLFGKYTGRFWIPPHVRGNENAGISEHVYTAEPES